MSDIVSPLLQWLNANPEMAGLVTFIISAAESVAIIGTIVPGSIMMTALGALAGAGVIPLYPTIFWAIMGAIVGDGISYWLGHYFKDRLPKLWPFRNYPGLLKSGEKFVHRYGYMSVFIGRFVGPVRALVPLVAGMLGMKPSRFIVANVTSAIGWAPAYMLPGILLGAASLELPPDIAAHVMLVLLLMALFTMLCLWFLYKLALMVHVQTQQLQIQFWGWLKQSRYFWAVASLLKHHDSIKDRGQLTLAFYFIVTSFAFICMALYVKVIGPANIAVNNVVFHFFRGIHNPTADQVMVGLTLLGQKQVVIPVILILFVWLIISKRWRAACHALALAILASGSVYVIKNLLRTTRPWGIMGSPDTFSMPSGHSTLSMTAFMGFAFLIACWFSKNRRWPIYLFCLMIAIAVGVSRLYLGAHWLTDVLSSWLLSAALLMLVIISYQRYREAPINPVSLTLVSLLALSICLGSYYHHFKQSLLQSYAQQSEPVAQVSLTHWWQANDVLPAYRTRVFGFPSVYVNLEWAGDLQKIREALIKEGWTTPPKRDFVTVLHRIADIKSTQYLALVSPQYLDKTPALILTRFASGSKTLVVLRLWNANRSILETGTPVWVGVVGIAPRTYSWITKSASDDVTLDPKLVFPNKTGMGSWQWKIITLNNIVNAREDQTIMLIRENKSAHKKQ